MKALITGGTGFVGVHLVRSLHTLGIKCRVLIRSDYGREVFRDLDKIEFYKGDVTKKDSLKDIAENIDYVFHLASEGHITDHSEEGLKKFIAVNVEGSRNLIEECGKHIITKFVHFSSTAAMGLIKKPVVDEFDPPQPEYPYQKSKLLSEQTVLETAKEYGVPAVVVRPCMIYGVNGYGEFYKICQLMKKGFFPKVGFGKNLTPLVHVKDVVQGALKAAQRGIDGEVYLLTSECSIEMDRLRELVMEGWGSKAVYPYIPVWLMYVCAFFIEKTALMFKKPPIITRRNIASTVWDREFSINKAKNTLGYLPEVDFRSGVLETVEWFKTQKGIKNKG